MVWDEIVIGWNCLLFLDESDFGRKCFWMKVFLDESELDTANSQEEADSETFVMGSDAAELVNKVQDQVRNGQKKVERCGFWRRTFNNLGNVKKLRRWMRRHWWKRISWIMKIPSRIPQISPWRKCSTSQKNWWANRKRLVMWQNLLGKSFIETAVIDRWRNCCQSPTRKSLRLLRFCVVLWKGPSTFGIQRSLEEKDWVDHHWKKPLTESTESLLISSGTSSQD